jgi:hypothetical protein
METGNLHKISVVGSSLLPSIADPQSISVVGVWRADAAGLGS